MLCCLTKLFRNASPLSLRQCFWVPGLVPPGMCLKWSCLSKLGRDAPCPPEEAGVGGERVGAEGGPGWS